MYQYGWLDKVTQITEGDKVIRSFRYHMDGQLAAAYDGSNTETFLWDGLALIRRDTTNYLNEPAVTGGNPVIAGKKTLFNDLLGSTLGAKSADGFSAIKRDAFGEVKPGETADLGINFFTGKPQVEGLGYTFLFRNYRPDQGKWQTTDPLGYPDGWNNLAYCNNKAVNNIDRKGLCRWVSPDGSYITVPFYEEHPEYITPPGYTYVPCDSEFYVDESRLSPKKYLDFFVRVDCGAPPIRQAAGSYGDDDYIAGYFPEVSYNCGQDLESHNGYQVYNFTGYVYLNPVYEEYECGRKIIRDYEMPHSLFHPRYSFSVTCIETYACEE